MSFIFIAFISFSISSFAETVEHKSELSFEEVILKTNPYVKKQITKKKMKLDKTHLSTGYIQVIGINGGEFDGRNDYYFFRGTPSNLVLHDSQEQSLELTQDFDLFLVTGNEIEKIKLDRVVSLKEIKQLYKKGPHIISHSWTTCCYEFYELPIKDKEIKVVIANDDPNHYNILKAEKAILGTLSWNGNKFELKKIKNPKIIKMNE